MAMREGFLDVCGLATRVVTYGGWIDEPNPSNRLILCITGNPGVTGYYKTFLSTLHAETGIPVWVISHAGHELPRESNETLKANLDSYNLAGQTRHKLAFIARYVPSHVTLTLVGHSIGCKVILDALCDLHERVDHCYLMFPTVERMAETPNGRFLVNRVKPFVSLIVLASWLFSVLPFIVKRFLIACWFLFDGSPTTMAAVTIRLVRPVILRNVFYLAFDEMDRVTRLDPTPITRFADKLTLYYGASDNWAPLGLCRDMKASFPQLRVMQCERGFDHSFVLNASTEVGLMVAGMIQELPPCSTRP